MKNYVQGEITDNNSNLKVLSGDLLSLGYQVEGSKFTKVGQIESIVNELVPYLEKQGINVYTDLQLVEFDEKGIPTGSYKKGRVERLQIKNR